MRAVLRVGAVSGAIAGATMALFLATLGRDPIRAALAIESTSHDPGAAHDEMFSRGVQEIGGGVALLLYGLALGVVFAIVFASAARRLPARTPLCKSVQLGVIGFVTVALVPFLKYPANPPAVGDPDTIDERTIQYLSVLAASIVLTVLVFVVAGRLRHGVLGRAWILSGLYGAGLLTIMMLMPDNAEAASISADIIWSFRLASIGGLAAAWAMLGLVAGTLFTAEARAAQRAGDVDAAGRGYADVSP